MRGTTSATTIRIGMRTFAPTPVWTTKVLCLSSRFEAHIVNATNRRPVTQISRELETENDNIHVLFGRKLPASNQTLPGL